MRNRRNKISSNIRESKNDGPEKARLTNLNVSGAGNTLKH